MYNGISIIVLAYNNYENIEKTFKSIMKQNFNEIEIIFSDDCSSNLDRDKVKSLIDSILGNKYTIKYIFNDKNLGTVRNFNNAIKNSKNDIIVPLSLNDELFDESTISSIFDYFMKEKCLIATSYREVTSDNQKKNIFPKSIQISTFENGLKDYIVRYGNFITGANIYYTKKFFEKYGLFDEKYLLLEDIPKIYSVLLEDCKISFFPIKGIKYSASTGISNEKKLNPKLIKDQNLLYSCFFKNENKRNCRFLKFRIRYNRTHYKLKKMMLCLFYLDVSINYIMIKRKEKYGI